MGKRRANGEGTIYSTIQKNKKEFDNTKLCDTCKNCVDKSKCNNRQGWEKCEICKQCTACLKYCDRFYCYKKTQAQDSIDGKRKSSGSGKTEKDVKIQKEEKVKQFNAKKLLKNGDLTLSEVMRRNEKDKLEYKIIKTNSYNRNLDTIQLIERFDIANKKVSELTQDNLKELFSILIELKKSQSYIEKVYDEIKQAVKISKNLEIFEDLERDTFLSDLEIEEVTAFTVEEQKKILDYINANEKTLVNESKSNIDSITVKNIIKLDFATSMRIGELCSLNKNENIDREKKRFIVKTTVTKDLDRKDIIGTTTKTGRKKKKSGQKDTRYVPFNLIFDENEVENIINEQCNNSINDLLFSTKDGKLISHSSINTIFKRICKQAGVKIELKKGCHVHMIKHSAVTRMIEFGMDIYAISKVVGTSVRVLTKTYAHIFDDFVDREIEKSKKVREETGLKLTHEKISNCKVIPFRKYMAVK